MNPQRHSHGMRIRSARSRSIPEKVFAENSGLQLHFRAWYLLASGIFCNNRGLTPLESIQSVTHLQLIF